VAQGLLGAQVESPNRVVEPHPHVERLAAGPQRIHAPGPGLPRPHLEQEGRRRAPVSAAGRQLPALLL